MKKKIIFSTLLVVVSTLIFSACSPKEQTSDADNEKASKEMAMQKDSSFKGSLKDLISVGKPQKCTWQEDKEKTSGVTYTDGKRSYSEASNVPIADLSGMHIDEESVAGKPEKGSMYTMYDGEYVYTWSSVSKEGLKMKSMNEDSVKDTEKTENYDDKNHDEGKNNSEYLKTMESEIDYKCTSWKLDESMFNLPSGIVFKDFSEMMNNSKKSFEGMNDVCSMLKGEDQENCLKDWAKAQEQMKNM